MITAYEVGAVFRIQDDATPTLQRIAREFKELQGLVDKTNESLAAFGKGIPFKRMTEGFTALNTQMRETAASATTIAAAFDGSVDKSIDGAIAQTKLLKDELRSAAVAAGEIRIPAGGGRGGGGGGAGSAAGGLSSLTPGRGTRLPPGGGGHGRGGGPLGTLGASVPGPGHTHLRSHSPFVLGAVAAGLGIWEGFDKYADLATIEENMRIGNVSPENIQKAENLSYNVGQKYGLPVQNIMKSINEIRSPLGGMEPAMEHIETLAKASVILNAQDSKDGGHSADQIYDLVKSAEFRNAIAPKDFDKAIHGMVAADVGTGGRVNPGEFLRMSKYMRSALPGLSDDFLYKYAPELAQEYSGAGGGTGMSSLYQQMEVAMRTTGINMLDKLGDIDPNKVVRDNQGRIKTMEPGANRLGDMFKRNPADAMAQLVEDLKSHGHTDEGDQRNWFSSIFGNKVAANMAMTLAYQRARLDRGANVIGNVWGTDDASGELLANDPRTKERVMTSSFGNMMTSLGGATVGPVSQFFKDATDLFNFIRDPNTSSQWKSLANMANHPVTYANAPQASWYDDMQANQSLHRAGYRNGDLGREMGRESARGAASPGAVVQPQIEVKVNLKAYIDGKEIAVAVEQDVMPMILKEVAGALHMANLNNQGGGGGSLDAAHITGAGHH